MNEVGNKINLIKKKEIHKFTINVVSGDKYTTSSSRLSETGQEDDQERKKTTHRLPKHSNSAKPSERRTKGDGFLWESGATAADPNKQLPVYQKHLHTAPPSPGCDCSGEMQVTTHKSKNICEEKDCRHMLEESKRCYPYDHQASGRTSKQEQSEIIFPSSNESSDQAPPYILEPAEVWDFGRVVKNDEARISPSETPPRGKILEESVSEYFSGHSRKEPCQLYTRHYEKKTWETQTLFVPKTSDATEVWKNVFLNFVQNTLESIIVFHPCTFLSFWGLSRQERMRHEIARLATFHSLNRLAVSAIRLAMSGFYYEEETDEIKCFSCGVCKRHWEKSERPALVHLEISPDCNHANFRDSSNVPFDEKNYTLLETSAKSQTMQATPQQTEGHRQPSVSSLLMEPRADLDPEKELENRNELTSGEKQMPAISDSDDKRNQAKADSSSLMSSGMLFMDGESSPEQFLLKPGSGNLGDFKFVASSSEGFSSTKVNHATPKFDPVGLVYTTLQGYSDAYDRQFNRFPVQAQQPAVWTYQLPTAESEGSAESRDSDQKEDIADPSTPGLDLQQAASPMNTKIITRLLSFEHSWSSITTGQNPKELSLAGFYYLGVGDSVRCFYCAITLHEWKPGDDPWVVHVLARFSCAYVTAVKGDAFVVRILTSHAQDRRWRPLSNEQLQLPSSSVLPGTSSRSGTRNSLATASGEYDRHCQSTVGEGRSATVSRSPSLASPASPVASTSSVVSTAVTKAGDIGSSLAQSGGSRERAGPTRQTDGEVTDGRGSHIVLSSSSSLSRAVSAADVADTPSRLTPVNPNLDTQLRQLVETNRRLRERRTCKLCHVRTVDTIFLPCGHICTCETCAKSIKSCILCYENIRGTAHVYLD